MTEMDWMVNVGSRTPRDAARVWLRANEQRVSAWLRPRRSPAGKTMARGSMFSRTGNWLSVDLHFHHTCTPPIARSGSLANQALALRLSIVRLENRLRWRTPLIEMLK